ncbi:MAG TPA: site-specific DNA-methyltransferase [Dehalococcoidia bacterium]|jgi:site-specific DNA-methyltransferase (adenine-specific)|nr:SAM-dependent methyltransferase [Chloroflexota bacterium]MDP6056257.1 site-specific DNA-methyltransferase [Dehalococcoidia bacterium]MDP7090225.1 site-specific DNA-methyltransferase [Dehalococcoidia bacterium]MDP7261064.1 site-specific DNA-methyltransferase [Dehalococcoidia bacterium]MDP7485097.1 site-specific DNA-methyltransferase [Dehalococcoidia bacterium]|tara:strand:- start:1096 stop:2046 length:951 start_codon:yes stop_codon:yes gene_type:complete
MSRRSKAVPKQRPTSTSSFGTNGRFSHDSSEYYARALQPDDREALDKKPEPEQSIPADILDTVINRSSEKMTELPDRSVHLMVTSPPYNVGKDYDDDLTHDQYMKLIGNVMQETYRILVDGGRALVNIANLGRKPYIPLHAYLIEQAAIAGFHMRGEIIWNKSAGAGTSTAWGSWMSPSNPTLRDTHEYILVFQKPPFGRKPLEGREATITRDDFLEFTKSVWEFAPQSAKQVGHPAPFPEELPRRAIDLYTFSGEVVLDPFMGTGSTALAAVRNSRHFVGYDVSSEYVELANQRLEAHASGKKFKPPAVKKSTKK